MKVQISTGEVVEFPDGMSQDEMLSALRRRYPPKQPAAAPAVPPTLPQTSHIDFNSLPREQQIDEIIRRRRFEMFGHERHPIEVLQDPSAPPEERMQIAQQMVRDNGKDWVRWGVSKVPFGGIAGQATTSVQAMWADERIKAGQGRPEDFLLLADVNHQAELAEEESWAQKTADLAAHAPGIYAEYALTGQAMGPFAQGASRAAIPVVRSLMRSMLAKGGKVAAAATIRATLNPAYAVNEYAQRKLKGESDSAAAFHGFMSSVIDMATEEFGVNLPTPELHKAFGRFASSALGKPISDLSKAGYHGALAEMLEERAAELLKGAMDRGDFQGVTGDLLAGSYKEAGKQIASELVAFLGPGLASHGAGAMQRADQRVETAATEDNRKKLSDSGVNFVRHEVAYPVADTTNEEIGEQYGPLPRKRKAGASPLGTGPLTQRVPVMSDEPPLGEQYGPSVKPRKGGPSPAGQEPLSRFLPSGRTDQINANDYFSENPGRIAAVASLPDNPSRTEFAKATGLPRASSNQELRRNYVQTARDLAESYVVPESEEQASQTTPDLVALSQTLPKGQFQKLITPDEGRESFRQQLQDMPASQIAEQYGWKKGKRKQWMIDRVMERFAPPTTADNRRQTTDKPPTTPEPTPEPIPEPATKPVAKPQTVLQPTPAVVPTKQAVARELPPVAEPEPLSPAVQAVYDQLPSDKAELESLAQFAGITLPKRGTKARQAINAAQLRRDIAIAMADPKSRKGLTAEERPEDRPPRAPEPTSGEEQGPWEEFGPREEYGPWEQVGPKQQFGLSREPVKSEKPFLPEPEAKKQKAFISGLGKDLPGQQTFIDVDGLDGGEQEKSKGLKKPVKITNPRDTSDQTVAEGLRFVKRFGIKAKEVRAKEHAHKEVEEFGANLGVRVVWIKPEGKPGSKFGFSYRGVAFVSVDNPAEAIWEVAGHEIAHATSIDKMREEFDADVVERYAQKYYDRAPDWQKKRLDASPERRFREGVAKMVGEFMGDAALRKQLRDERPSLWKRIVDRVSALWDRSPVSPLSKEFKSVKRVLTREMNRPEYRQESVRLRVRDTIDAEIELGNIKEADRKEAEAALTENIQQVHREKTQAVEDREAAKAYIKKRIGMNAGNIAWLENRNQDAAAVKDLDVASSDAASQWPGVFSGRGYEDNDVDYAREGWELIKEAAQEAPAIDSDEVYEEAAARTFTYEGDLKALAQKVKEGENKELFGEIVEAIREEGIEVDDIELEALRRLRELQRNLDEDIPFMAEEEVGEEPNYRDPRLRRIAAIPGAKDLARKLFADKKRIPSQKQIETQRAFGRANPGTTLAAREQVLREDLEQGPPAYRPRTYAEKRAQQLIAKKGAEHYLKKFSERFKKGNFFFETEVETVIARDLLNETAIASVLTQSEQAKNDFAALVQGYRMARTEQARQLSLRDPIWTDSTKLHNRALQDAILNTDPKTRQRILDQLKRNDIDINDPNLTKDRDKVIRALAIARNNTPGSWADMIYEYYLNSILSGPQTQIANAIGNITNALWYNSAERFGEITVGAVRGLATKGEVRDLKELAEVWKGMGHAITTGLANANRSWKYEYSPLNVELGHGLNDSATQLNISSGKIPGRIGRVVRTPFRMLLWADEFARTITAHGAAAGHAYREAKQQGIATDKIAEFIGKQVADRTSPVWEKALAEANYQAFQQQSGVIGQQAKQAFKALKKVWGVRYVIPFDNFLVNSFSRAADIMPFAGPIAAAVNEVAYRQSGGRVGVKPNWDRLIFNQAAAMAALGIIFSVLGEDDDEGFPRITGTRKRNLAARAGQYRTAPPLSIRIGKTYYNYSRIEPFNVFLSTLVDYYEAAKTGEGGIMDRMEKSAIAQVQDKNYMQGFADIASIFEREGNAMDLAANTAVGFVPNLYRQTLREARNEVAETRLKEDDNWAEWSQKLLTKAELPVTGMTYRYDIWGRKLNPNTPTTSLPYRVLSPVKLKSKKDVLPVDVAIMNWNELHPDQEFNFGTPNPPRGLGKVSSNEFETYARERGLVARGIVEQIKFSSPPTLGQMKAIRTALTRGTEIAKNRLIARRAGRTPEPLRGYD